MTTTAFREASGDVVMKSDNFAIRFMTAFGAAPLQIFEEGSPMLSNDYAGSGVQLNWEVGQDPTQASANGLTKNPIARLNYLATAKYNYYIRELIVDPIGIYKIAGFFPDFWLSHESIDDKIIANAAGTQKWATKYNPRGLPFWGVGTSSRVAFIGDKNFPTGLFAIGNEMEPGTFRKYPEGRFAAKVTVGLKFAGTGAGAGIIFKTNFSGGIENNIPNVDHLRFTVNTSNWYLIRTGIIVKKGSLNSSAKLKVKSEQGLEIEVRTHNGSLNYVECYVDGIQVCKATVSGAVLNGENAGLYALCSLPTGYVMFDHRQFFDVSAEAQITYTALPGGRVTLRTDLVRAGGAEHVSQLFYRGGMQFFLNATTFGQDRVCKAIKQDGSIEVKDGYNLLLADYKAFFVGNSAGLGIRVEPKEFLIDGVAAAWSHCLMQSHALNDEFYLGLNCCPVLGTRIAKNISMVIECQTRL